jgi:hypothetical protein
MKRTALALALILTLLVSSVIGFWCVISNSTFAWNSQTVDAKSGLWSSLALDSNNNPHISYSAVLSYNHRYGDFYLMYASWNGSAWEIQNLGPTDGSDSLKLDSANNPHIVYRNNSNLMYAKLEGSTWIYQIVDRDDIGFMDLALDSNGNPHISYCKGNALKYASWTNASWRIQTVDSQAGYQNSIALDAKDYPQIFYGKGIQVTEANVGLLNLKYAAWTGSTWNIQTVTTNVSQVGKVVLDSYGSPHICYVSADIRAFVQAENTVTFYETDTLKYAFKEGSAWKIQTVAQGKSKSNPDNFKIGSLALDASNNPHMSFYEAQYNVENVVNGMKYASWTGFYWHIQEVNSDVIDSGPLALDSNGMPHVSYCTLDPGQTYWLQGDLVYAVPVEPFSTPEPFPTSLVIAYAITAAVVGIGLGLLLYGIKRK